MNRKLLIALWAGMTCILALSFPLGLTGCNQAELKTLEAELSQTKQQRNELQKNMKELTESHEQAQVELDMMRKRADEDTKTIAALEEQIQELTESRDAAVAEVKAARLKIEELEKNLEVETEKVQTLQEQLKEIRAAVTRLQGRLKP